jgi:hypothetical protein
MSVNKTSNGHKRLKRVFATYRFRVFVYTD